MEQGFRILLLCSTAAAFVYGVRYYFRKKAPLFNQIVTCAVGCMMLGRLFDVVMMVVTKSVPTWRSLSFFGVFGGFMFLYSASYGQMDGLVDGRERHLRKYRLLAGLAPMGIAVFYIPVWWYTEKADQQILNGVLFLMLALASYYQLKHLIIPDVEFGILKCIHRYNLLSLLLTVLYAMELCCTALELTAFRYVVSVLISADVLLMIPVLRRGSRKWTI